MRPLKIFAVLLCAAAAAATAHFPGDGGGVESAKKIPKNPPDRPIAGAREERKRNLYRVPRDGGGGKGGKKGGKKGQDLMSRILPMMVMPFLISSSMIPMVLMSLKMMLLKSMVVGKIAILLLAINMLWRSGNQGGVYSHNINVQHEQKDLHMAHYGFDGFEEPGAYVNNRKKRSPYR